VLRSGVDLILFAGGDGTARDIYEVVGTRAPVLGIPAGVKIHSAVFAVNPRTAGSLAVMYLQDKVSTHDAEVMDIDEETFRKNIVSAKLYGYLRVPHERLMVQNAKIGGIQNDLEAIEAIAWDVIDNMRDDCLYIIGPGTTAKSIMKQLGLEYTLLGVDVIHQRKLIALDVNEAQLLKLIEDKKSRIVVTVIGGQGFIFGRGNQQLSSKVLRKVGKENIIVIATGQKIASLRGKPLLVDTDNSEVNEMLRGYIRVTTGYDKALIYKVA